MRVGPHGPARARCQGVRRGVASRARMGSTDDGAARGGRGGEGEGVDEGVDEAGEQGDIVAASGIAVGTIAIRRRPSTCLLTTY